MAADIREWRRRAALADTKLRQVESHWTKAKTEIAAIQRVHHVPAGIYDSLTDTIYCLATSLAAVKIRSDVMARFGASDWVNGLSLNDVIGLGISSPRGTETGNQVLWRAVMNGLVLVNGLHDDQESTELFFGMTMTKMRLRVNEVLMMVQYAGMEEMMRSAEPTLRLLAKMDRWQFYRYLRRSQTWRDLEDWKLDVMVSRKYFLLFRATMEYATLSAMSTISLVLGLKMARQRLITEFMEGRLSVQIPDLKSWQELREKDEAWRRPRPDAMLQMSLRWWFRPVERRVAWWRRAEAVVRRKVRAMKRQIGGKAVEMRQRWITEYFPVIARRVARRMES